MFETNFEQRGALEESGMMGDVMTGAAALADIMDHAGQIMRHIDDDGNVSLDGMLEETGSLVTTGAATVVNKARKGKKAVLPQKVINAISTLEQIADRRMITIPALVTLLQNSINAQGILRLAVTKVPISLFMANGSVQNPAAEVLTTVPLSTLLTALFTYVDGRTLYPSNFSDLKPLMNPITAEFDLKIVSNLYTGDKTGCTIVNVRELLGLSYSISSSKLESATRQVVDISVEAKNAFGTEIGFNSPVKVVYNDTSKTMHGRFIGGAMDTEKGMRYYPINIISAPLKLKFVLESNPTTHSITIGLFGLNNPIIAASIARMEHNITGSKY